MLPSGTPGTQLPGVRSSRTPNPASPITGAARSPPAGPQPQLVAQGALFQSPSDSEVIVHLIARSAADHPEGQIREALEQVEGAYSLVIAVGRTIFCVVDPRGFRPLILGRLGDGILAASETW